MGEAYLNRIETAVPPNDVHLNFVAYAAGQLSGDPRAARLFKRMSDMGGIEHRYSFTKPTEEASNGTMDAEGIFRRNAFPSTGTRMRLFERWAPKLAQEAVERLLEGEDRKGITHLVVTCCTGMSAPGVDLQLVETCGLSPDVERTMVGFMGCYAAINGLKLARHIVRSEPQSRVLVLNIELCTLHLKESTDLEQMLSFYLFADGCAASLVTSEPQGARLDRFHAMLAPETQTLITWNVGDKGFDMLLSGQVPGAIRVALTDKEDAILDGVSKEEIRHWAVHPGGRTVLDAVQSSLGLPPDALWASREILREYGNMSSPTVMFVLKRLLEGAGPGEKGCAMAFGPGLVAETFTFVTA